MSFKWFDHWCDKVVWFASGSYRPKCFELKIEIEETDGVRKSSKTDKLIGVTLAKYQTSYYCWHAP